MPRTLGSLLFFSACLFAQSPFAGDWVFELQRFDQKTYERVKLTADGNVLRAEAAGLKVEGSATGNTITLRGKDEKGERQFQANGKLESGEIRGTAVVDGEETSWRAFREKPRPAAPATHTFEPTVFHRYFSSAIPPALRISAGDTVKTWTVDAGGQDAQGKKRSNGGNPETGPFYVEGAMPGDLLAVKLNRVRLNRDTAFSGTRVAGNALDSFYLANLPKDESSKDFDGEWILDRAAGVGRLKKPGEKLKDYRVPLRPMLGCIATAPPGDMSYRTGFLGGFGGNMDYNGIREGVTVYLPVFHPGALLFIGDGHAAQGDGELTGDALETSMDVEFTVEVLRGQGRGGVRFESDEYLMASGVAGSLDDALRAATTSLLRWMGRMYGLNQAESALLVGSAMRYDIAEIVDPQPHVVAKIPKKALETLKKVQ